MSESIVDTLSFPHAINTALDPQIISQSLEDNPHIKKVYLTWKGIDDEGAEIISGFLARNVIEDLALISNVIGTNGAKKLFEAVKSNSSLRKLDLWDAFSKNPSGVWLQEALQNNSHLEEINLSSNTLGIKGACDLGLALKSNSTLKKLVIHTNAFMDEGMEKIAAGLEKNTSLIELDLASNEITKVGAAFLANALKLNSALKELRLSKNRLGLEGFLLIFAACKSVENLKLDENTIDCTDSHLKKVFRKIRKTEKVEVLNVSKNAFGDEAAHLIGTNAVESLTLSFNLIQSKGMISIAQRLEKNNSLIYLNLEGNAIDDKAMQFFVTR